jgi:hypothetical protein
MDIVVEQILSSYDTITVVGASADPAKARAIAEGACLL